ncbi:glycosyltransferase family 87 protein [Winogradskyella sp. SYSU M77433]|uniref:glycosyltransferase family 87 protein n=1 Tax=Winogradskyella sp. SYSU M77433 TaxID=3042722 RepID=UPI002480B2A4|nr:glycosyltransferase family 87 protein [Winogradskyella sp. SYSU M77433]MDH7913361.1 glycosyltransferase family 87 protein [Winogradskyella sp. SYSU M77433]
MRNFLNLNRQTLIYFTPLGLVLIYFFLKSLSFPLHDFANSYFPADITSNSEEPELILFDIYNYNEYIWDLGYKEVLGDFYLNSPFNAVAFYPLTYVQNAYIAKAIFNCISILLFIISVYLLYQRLGKSKRWLIVAVPILFFIPLRNQIMFGQTYFLVFLLVVIGYVLFEKQKRLSGSSLLVTAALLKVFPIAYGLPLLFKREWKTILTAIIVAIVFLALSIAFTGISIWETYFFEVIPNAIKNKSTVNFQYNAQSMDVFLKTLFVKDDYYNPSAIFDNEQLYYALKWIYKSVVIGIAISLSLSRKNELFALLSIWVVTLFLLQSRTATYAQVLWLIPAYYIMSLSISKTKIIVFLVVLFLVCNLPIASLEPLPLVFKFSRLWLSIILAGLFFFSFNTKINYKYIALGFVILLPLHFDMFSKPKKDNSTYVLEEQKHFMIYDFYEEKGVLTYVALGKNGNEIVATNISIKSFDEASYTIVNNQVVVNGKQITDTPDLKKKPVLVNDCEVFFLTDSRSRRGAYTIKKIDICNSF